jgi:hypothetical protein
MLKLCADANWHKGSAISARYVLSRRGSYFCLFEPTRAEIPTHFPILPSPSLTFEMAPETALSERKANDEPYYKLDNAQVSLPHSKSWDPQT